MEHKKCSVILYFSGLDYVAHEDVLPYSTGEKLPIQHELFEKFLEFDPDSCKWIFFCMCTL